MIVNNRASGFWGIYIAEDIGDRNNNNKGAGIPEDILVVNNKIVNSTNGIRIEAGKRITVESNQFRNISGEEFVYLITEEDEEEKELISVALNPSDDAKVDIESPDRNYGIYDPNLEGERDLNFHKYFNIKSNSSKTTGRVGFFQFDIADLGGEIETALFQLSGRLGSNTTSVELAVFGLTENNWSEETITWNTAPNLSTNRVEVTGANETAFFLGTFTVNQTEITEHSVDVSEFVKNAAGNNVSFLVIDLLGQGGNVNLYSKEEANSSRWPKLTMAIKE